jgi:hypothetical protein
MHNISQGKWVPYIELGVQNYLHKQNANIKWLESWRFRYICFICANGSVLSTQCEIVMKGI